MTSTEPGKNNVPASGDRQSKARAFPRPGYNAAMANPDKYPPPVMAEKFGIGKLNRHLFVCLGPDCVDPAQGQQTWDYVKRRMKQLNIAGPDGPCYRTKCDCLRICIDGPIAVVYPEGTWYRQVTP